MTRSWIAQVKFQGAERGFLLGPTVFADTELEAERKLLEELRDIVPPTAWDDHDLEYFAVIPGATHVELHATDAEVRTKGLIVNEC